MNPPLTDQTKRIRTLRSVTSGLDVDAAFAAFEALVAEHRDRVNAEMVDADAVREAGFVARKQGEYSALTWVLGLRQRAAAELERIDPKR